MKKRTKNKPTASKRVKTKTSSCPTGAEQDIIGLLTMLVQKLTSFEAKLDMVLSRISPQPIAAANAPKQQPAIVPAPKPARENRHMHKAVCADCGMDCEVPFKPREDRKVYCKECFIKRKNNKGVFKPQEIRQAGNESGQGRDLAVGGLKGKSRRDDKPKQETPVTVNTAFAEKPKAFKPVKSSKKKKPAAKKKTKR